jgi:hypothetical protein
VLNLNDLELAGFVNLSLCMCTQKTDHKSQITLTRICIYKCDHAHMHVCMHKHNSPLRLCKNKCMYDCIWLSVSLCADAEIAHIILCVFARVL